jgi:hypothetical protein
MSVTLSPLCFFQTIYQVLEYVRSRLLDPLKSLPGFDGDLLLVSWRIEISLPGIMVSVVSVFALNVRRVAMWWFPSSCRRH